MKLAADCPIPVVSERLSSSPVPARTPLSWRTAILLLLAACPVLFIAMQVAMWTRNIPNWDEFDTAIDLLIALDLRPSLPEIGDRLFALQNEHRTAVSRLIFAVSYWISGGIDFVALAVLGNLFLAGVFWLLLARVDAGPARLRLAAIFSLAVFQLQHHESLYWAGSSIDHFLVVLASIAALAALTSRSGWSLPAACLLGFVATFSLAHGLLVWPLGVMLLWMQKRPRAIPPWAAAAAGSIALFASGFSVNPGHPIPGYADLPRVIVYWLTLVGSSPALDHVELAPWLGGVVVLAMVALAVRGFRSGERLPLTAAAWCLGAMALIAGGRALLATEWAPITSRYVILSSISCALVLWIFVERLLARQARAGQWCLGGVLVLLVAFNLAANQAHEDAGRVFAQHGEKAVEAFHRHGTFASGETQLYPDPERADLLIRLAQERGIYRLPRLEALELADPEPVVLTESEEIGDGCYFIEEVKEDATELRVRGWAFRPDHTTRAGDISVVFRNEETAIAFEATPQVRPDVAAAFERADATHSGFELRLPRHQLPPGVFGIGVCFDLDDAPEYMMTANTIVIPKSPVVTMHLKP